MKGKSNKKLTNKAFDKILKENLESLFLPISEKWLGFKIIESLPLPEKLQTTLEREPDFVRIIKTATEEKFILHLEFQSTNDSEMAHRQAEYKAILQRRYKIPVRQFVIYLGNLPVKMKTQLPEEQHITGFELLALQTYDYEKMIASDVPEEIMLAILGDFHQEEPEEVIQKIVARLQKISRGKLELEKYVQQLNTLSKLRKLEELTIQITEAMPIEYDIETDYAFKRGIERGAEREKRLAQTQKREAIIKMLQDGFLKVEQIANYQDVSIEEVLQVKQELENQE